MNKTLARIRFKEHFGQANHYLITNLVGLHNLNLSAVVEAPEELRTSWNPHDKNSSINRSRIFLLHSFLGWAVDSLDMYVSLLNRKPDYLQNSKLRSELDGAGRSVLRKVIVIGEHYEVHPATLALVDILITWRNNVFHDLADNEIRPNSANAIAMHSIHIQESYRGLITSDLPDKAHGGKDLTFKETASLINAAHNFVKEVDASVLAQFDVMLFCEEAITDALKRKDQTDGFRGKYYGLSTDKRKRFVGNWLRNIHGFAQVKSEILEKCVSLQCSRDVG